MLKCKCGREIPFECTAYLCVCGSLHGSGIEIDNSQTVSVSLGMATPLLSPANPWVILHSRYASAIKSGQWDESVEHAWLDFEFAKLIPCGTCGGKWLEIKPLMNLSSPESAFRSSWEVHNIVSTQHVQPPKEPITFEECQALYLNG